MYFEIEMNYGNSFIYIVKCTGSDYYKVGLTTTVPETRLQSLQVGCPYELTLEYLLQIPKTYVTRLEKYLHTSLGTKRNVTGEWFKFKNFEDVLPELDEYVARFCKEEKIYPALFFISYEDFDYGILFEGNYYNCQEEIDYILDRRLEKAKKSAVANFKRRGDLKFEKKLKSQYRLRHYKVEELIYIKENYPKDIYEKIKNMNRYCNANYPRFYKGLRLYLQGNFDISEWNHSTPVEDLYFFVTFKDPVLNSL